MFGDRFPPLREFLKNQDNVKINIFILIKKLNIIFYFKLKFILRSKTYLKNYCYLLLLKVQLSYLY